MRNKDEDENLDVDEQQNENDEDYDEDEEQKVVWFVSIWSFPGGLLSILSVTSCLNRPVP